MQDTTATDLYGFWLPRGKVDLVVDWHSTDQSVIASVASRFHCTVGDAVRPDPARIQSAQLDTLASSAVGNESQQKEISDSISNAQQHRGVDPSTGQSLQVLREKYSKLPSKENGQQADQARSKNVQRGSRGVNTTGICDPILNSLIKEMRTATDPLSPQQQIVVALPFLQKIEQRLGELGLVLPIWPVSYTHLTLPTKRIV